MKQLIKYILTVYFVFLFTIGNAGIPYLLHTCTISNESDLHFFTLHSEDECCFTSCSTDLDEPLLIKDSCCVISKGIIKTDIEPFHSQIIIEIDKSIVNQSNFLFGYEINFKTTAIFFISNSPPILSGRQISILHQTFLC